MVTRTRLNVLLIYNYPIRIANALPFCRVFYASPLYVSNCQIFPIILFTEYIKNTASTEGLSIIRIYGRLLSANKLEEIVVDKHRTFSFHEHLTLTFSLLHQQNRASQGD